MSQRSNRPPVNWYTWGTHIKGGGGGIKWEIGGGDRTIFLNCMLPKTTITWKGRTDKKGEA